ncbi:MAG TPA: DUF993 family protein [Micromonosporaceae bacterium]|nr:DUF993 family protein [Micromonosporaceae bacterium]
MRVDLPSGPYTFSGAGQEFVVPGKPFTSRVAYAAAHVVADPLASGAPPVLDWDATLAFRQHVWRHGFGVAEAMDTAQRGMGLDYPTSRELIHRSAREATGPVVAGVGTDQLPAGPATLDQVRRAYADQLADVLAAGATPVLMCSRHLAAAARSADDYLIVYSELIEQSDRPVLLHWLGEMFDPALAGYWGSSDLDSAMETVLTLCKGIDGVKLSLLDEAFEVRLRRRLPPGVRLYTGDDFHYPALIRGDERGHSDALLGIFDAIAPVAAAALRALDAADLDSYVRLFEPTVPLARHMFCTPTRYYKTGIVFLAWLAGHQNHFTMVGGLQSGRSARHLIELCQLADRAGLLPDAELAAYRVRAYLTTVGVPQ